MKYSYLMALVIGQMSVSAFAGCLDSNGGLDPAACVTQALNDCSGMVNTLKAKNLSLYKTEVSLYQHGPSVQFEYG